MRGIFQTIERYAMIDAGMRVVAGVSGGADSVCLLYVLTEYQKRVPFQICVVHVEHGLRGEESLEDAAFVEALCERFEVPCRVVHAGVRELARENGLSLEEAGRAERYRIFSEIRKEEDAQRIAVAHNRDDQAETVIWNLARGSGLRGLGGIRPVRDEIIRPLLQTDRAHIEELLQKAGLSWRTDRTNLEQEYTRNRVRLSVLPQMQRELNHRAPEHIAQAAQRLQQVQEFVDRMTDRAAGECIRCAPEVTIVLPALNRQDPLIRQELFRRALKLAGAQKDVGSVHLEALTALAGMDCGKSLNLPGRIRAVRENQVIRLTQRTMAGSEGTDALSLPEELELPVPGACDFPGIRGGRIRTELMENRPELMREILEEKKYTKWLSYDTIKGNILLRHRRAGDYLVIDARGGRKKLKDYLIDLKIPRDLRDQLWLLADGAHVLWMPGYRISAAARVRKDTKRVIKIQMEDEAK